MKKSLQLHIAISAAIFTLLGNICNAGENNRELTVNTAVEEALQNNLSLTLQKEEVLSSQGRITAAQGDFDFIFSAKGGYVYQEISPVTTGAAEEEETGTWSVSLAKKFSFGTHVQVEWANSVYEDDTDLILYDPLYNSGLSLSLSQPLLQGFGIANQTAEIVANEKLKEANTYLVSSKAANLAADVKNAYWNLVYAWQDIKVKKLSLKLAKKLLEETKEKIDAGSLAQIDIYTPESEVARREQDLISAERTIGAAEDQIKLLINSNDWFTEITPTDSPTTDKITIDLKEILENSLANRPDIKAAELTIQSADINRKKAKNGLLPSLTLSGKYTFSGTEDAYSEAMGDSFSDTDDQWQAGIAFSMPLNNRSAKGLHTQAETEYNKAKTNSALLKQQVRQSVKTTVRDVQLAIKTMEAAKKTSFASKKGLEAEEVKFQAGRATAMDVLTAQELYATALSQENLAKITYAQSLAELDRIQGKINMQ